VKILIKKYGKNISSTLHFSSFSEKEKKRIIQYVTSRGFPSGLLLEVLRKPKEEYTDDRE
jgi:SOS response regulatory protein OraA/RecX